MKPNTTVQFAPLSHLDHHLYHVLAQLCHQMEKCTCSRETLARMIGASPASKQPITDAIKKFEALGMLSVHRPARGSWTITIHVLEETKYSEALWDDIEAVISEGQLERESRSETDLSVHTIDSESHKKITDAFQDDAFNNEAP